MEDRGKRARRRAVVLAATALALVAALVAAVVSLEVVGDGRAAEPPVARAQPAGSWDLAHRDDFDSLDRSVWGVYDGPGNGDTGPRDEGNTFVDEGLLVLRTTQVDGEWHGAGVSSAPGGWTQTYGRYQARVRFEPGYGVRAVALLWPTGGWPPEVDFFEVTATRSDRTQGILTNHYSDGRDGRGFDRLTVDADFTQWHTVGLEWTPGRLTYTLDGQVVAEMTRNVPDEPMWLGLQTAQGVIAKGIVPDARRTPQVDLFVDWVQVDAWAGEASGATESP